MEGSDKLHVLQLKYTIAAGYLHGQITSFSNISTKFNPLLWQHEVVITILTAEVGIKSCRGARECVSFVYVCMYVHSYPAAIPYLNKHM